jgi:benzoyl-CoA reductase/2-hydroxyglutaryl-CoA dehydratase subunit BcrC/BadD/HgdB
MVTEQKKNVIKDVLDYLSFATDTIVQRFGERHPEWAWIYSLLVDYYGGVYKAKEEGKPVAWINFGVPPEIFYAMDMVPVVVDALTGSLSSSGNATKYIDVAEARVPDYICANNKILIGAALAGDAPIPDILVHPAHPCDSNLATYPVIAEYFNFPYFCIDMPYFRNERSAPYIAGELRKLISLLEEITGKRLDMGKLKQVMQYSNQAHELILKHDELRQAVPCPYSSLEAISEYGLVLALAGTPQLVDYFERRYELSEGKVSRGEGHLSKEGEKHRLVWIYGAPTFDMTIFMWLEKEYGALSVANMNNNFTMKPVEDISNYEKILMGLAEKVTLLPMTRECGGPWENWLDASIDLIKRYKADAAVFGGHVACKSNWAVIKLVKDKLHDELGIPTLVLEMDLFDPRIASSDALKAQFDNFFNVHLQG